jgi:hypothetical protein
MRLGIRATLIFWLAIAGVLGRAQEQSIPFEKMQSASQPDRLQRVAGANGEDAIVTSETAPANGNATLALRPIPSRKPGSRYFLLNGIHLGLALLDVQMTQHCIAEDKCTEGNPIMPSSRAGQIGFNLGVVTFSALASYKAWRHDEKIWWIAPAAGIAAHTAGVVTGIAHR